MKKDVLALFFVFVVSLFLSRDLLGEGYFRMHDGIVPIRQLTMEKCLKDRQMPCRWGMDMGGGFGYPIFNYYPPLPYAFAEVFRIAGFSLSDTVKLNFIFVGILAGIFMYLLGKVFFGRLGGMLSASFYLLSPYRAVDMYVRGALNESWAFVWFPLIFLFSFKVIKNKSKSWILLLAISWAGLLLSHSLMSLILFPLWLVWFLVAEDRGSMKRLAAGAFLGLMLSSFFVLPAILEKNLVAFDMTSGYFNFRDHFATLYQLLVSRSWGYGQSYAGTSDTMAFMVGQVHWLLTIPILLIIVLKKKRLLLFLVVVYGWLAVFMSSSLSYEFWNRLPFLQFLQFPWRFLSIAAFSFSFAVGYVFSNFLGKRLIKYLVFAFLLAGVFLSNYEFFRAQMVSLNGRDISESEFWAGINMVSINDYLPKTVINFPSNQSGNDVDVLEGEGQVSDIKKGSDKISFKTDFKESGKIRLNIFYFPNWKVYSDNKEISLNVDLGGRINFDIEKGQHDVKARLTNTPIRTISNIISLLSWAVVMGYLLKKVL